MSLTNIEQFKKIISSVKSLLILLPQNPSGDAISSGWATYHFLDKLKIKTTIAVSDPLNNINRFGFLPTPKKIKNNLTGERDFILSFDTTRNKIIDIRTDQTDRETRIFITPEKGSIDPRDFSFIPAKFKYDAIFCLGSPDKESFGEIFEDSPDVFYEVPIVNIDNHSNNDNFGQINIVNITASSTSEIIYDIFSKLEKRTINEIIAECLLSGIISATNSFQNNKTTPRALQISSELMQQGANQQEIIRHLYKTQPFSLLKLWGRVMSNLKWEADLRLAWATIGVDDFVQSRSQAKDIPLILNKIQGSYEAAESLMILYPETNNRTIGLIKLANAEKLASINLFDNGRVIGDLYKFELNTSSIKEAQKRCLIELRNFLK